MNENLWTPEEIEYLRSQRALGTSGGKIATHLNRTRSSVIAKARRIQADTPNPPCARASAKTRTPAPIPTPDFNPDSRNLQLEDLAYNQCHYPYGDGHPRFFFCAADASSYPYCDFHRKIAYRAPGYR